MYVLYADCVLCCEKMSRLRPNFRRSSRPAAPLLPRCALLQTCFGSDGYAGHGWSERFEEARAARRGRERLRELERIHIREMALLGRPSGGQGP